MKRDLFFEYTTVYSVHSRILWQFSGSVDQCDAKYPCHLLPCGTVLQRETHRSLEVLRVKFGIRSLRLQWVLGELNERYTAIGTRCHTFESHVATLAYNRRHVRAQKFVMRDSFVNLKLFPFPPYCCCSTIKIEDVDERIFYERIRNQRYPKKSSRWETPWNFFLLRRW